MKQFENAKGCPFCGSNSVEPRSGFGIVQVKCHKCGAMFRFGAETDEQFIQKWNLRRPLSFSIRGMPIKGRGGEGMKVLDFALAVIEFVIALAMAHIIGLFPECSFERTMLVFILWQLHLQRRKVVK